jgi:hypothetical protein
MKSWFKLPYLKVPRTDSWGGRPYVRTKPNRVRPARRPCMQLVLLTLGELAGWLAALLDPACAVTSRRLKIFISPNRLKPPRLSAVQGKQAVRQGRQTGNLACLLTGPFLLPLVMKFYLHLGRPKLSLLQPRCRPRRRRVGERRNLIGRGRRRRLRRRPV